MGPELRFDYFCPMGGDVVPFEAGVDDETVFLGIGPLAET